MSPFVDCPMDFKIVVEYHHLNPKITLPTMLYYHHEMNHMYSQKSTTYLEKEIKLTMLELDYTEVVLTIDFWLHWSFI